MNKDSKIIIGAVGVVVILSILIFVAGFATGALIDSDTAKVKIETDGNSTNLTISSSWFNSPPEQMKQEIEQYTANEIKNPNSTVETIKAGISTISHKYNYTKVDVLLKTPYGDDQLVMVARVKGDSMYPTLNDGQSILVLKTKDFKVGDIVIARHPDYGLIVKRVSIIEENRVFLISDNTEQITISNSSGVYIETGLRTWVPHDDVIGVVKVY